jgi:hypothetical protein
MKGNISKKLYYFLDKRYKEAVMFRSKKRYSSLRFDLYIFESADDVIKMSELESGSYVEVEDELPPTDEEIQPEETDRI